MFFFARATELHLIDVHPEIILVATIGGIENVVFPESHCLDIVEARTAGRVPPDRVTPIENASFRNRCERHSAPPL
jgi:hypothetical protein